MQTVTQAPSLVEIKPTFYRQGGVTAFFKKGGRFSVHIRGAEVGGTRDHASYRELIDDLIADASLTDGDRESLKVIKDTMQRSLYDHYDVVTEEDLSA